MAVDAGKVYTVYGAPSGDGALLDPLAVLAITPTIASRRVAVDAGLELDGAPALGLGNAVALLAQPVRKCS